MKIDKVIMSCDDNSLYLDFWPLVSKVWKEVFNIDPLLLYFGEKELPQTHGKVLKYKCSISDSYYYCLWSRYWYPQNEPETTFIISDIDMFPLNRKYFIDDLKQINRDSYVHLCGTTTPLPSCYHVATGKTFDKFIELPSHLDDAIKFARTKSSGTTHSIESGSTFFSWGSDEEYGTNQLKKWLKFQKGEANLCKRKPNDRRLDRSKFQYKNEDLLNHEYLDFHSIRPFKENEEKIIKVVNLLYQSYNL